MKRIFFFLDPACLTLVGISFGVAFDFVHAFHKDSFGLWKKFKDLADLSLFLADHDHYFIIFMNFTIFHVIIPRVLLEQGKQFS